MTRVGIDMDGKGCGIPPIALRPDPERIGLAEEVVFERSEFRVRVGRSDVTKQGALG